MNWLDIVIVVIVGICAFIGLVKGLIKAVLSLAGLIVGIILAGHYYRPFSEHLTFIPTDTLAKVAAFLIILIGVMVLATLLARLLKWAASALMLGWVNRLGGAILGAVLGLLFCSAGLAIWAKLAGVEGALGESILARMLLDRFPMVLALLPDEFDVIRSFFEPS